MDIDFVTYKNEMVNNSFCNLLLKKDMPVGYHIEIIVGLDRVKLPVLLASFPLYIAPAKIRRLLDFEYTHKRLFFHVCIKIDLSIYNRR